jgi:hypothetical protein
MRERLVTVVAVLLSGLLSGWVGWMYLDNKPAYDYVRGEIQPNPAPQGGQVSLPWTIKVHRLCPGNVLRVLYDADTGKMVAAYDRTPSSISVKMGETKLVKTFQLPLSMPRNVRYTANVCFECNALQKFFPVCVQTPDLFFSVEQ